MCVPLGRRFASRLLECLAGRNHGTNSGFPAAGSPRRRSLSEHDVVDGGPFDRAFRAMPPALLLPFAATGTTHAPPKAPTKQGKRYRYKCPACETTLRGPTGKNILCVECGVLYLEEGAQADAVAA